MDGRVRLGTSVRKLRRSADGWEVTVDATGVTGAGVDVAAVDGAVIAGAAVDGAVVAGAAIDGAVVVRVDAVVLACPSHVAAGLLGGDYPEVRSRLSAICWNRRSRSKRRLGS